LVNVKVRSFESAKPGVFECNEITHNGYIYVERSDLPKLYVDLPCYVTVDGVRHEVFGIVPDGKGLYAVI
jgi:hypothetical protein